MTTLDPQSDLCSLALARWFDDLADVGILVTDDTLTIRAWNPWLVSHTGIATADAVGRHLFVVCPTIAARGLDQMFRDALAGEVRVLSHGLHGFLIPTIKSTATTGALPVAQAGRIAPISVNEHVVGTITMLEDVSERVASERALRTQIHVAERARTIAEDASKLKDEFLATLSHEIRTPLNAVLGWVRILRAQDHPKSPAHALDVIERNAVSQLRLVEDLLDTARVISGKLRLEIAPVAVQDVMQAAIDALEPVATEKHLVIQTWFDPARPTVNADADRLQQALWNVLSNAVKFTPRDGRIDVRIATVSGIVEVEITDSGQGISPGFLPYVFDRFRQADGSPSRRHGGLGLGLALVRHIVELHGGRVSVDSPGLNKGASFLVRLPVAETNAEPAQGELRSARPVGLAGVAIILVEDSRDGLEMLEAALRGYGATILALDSGEAALRVLSDERPRVDVLISDIGMPGLDGYELIRRVRSLPTTVRNIPAIAVTAYASPEERLLALAAGYQVHLSKPVDPALVGETVSRLLLASRRIPATK